MPTPTTPTWISPADGATVDASVTLQWTAGTVSGGTAAPTVTIVTPAEGANVPAGTFVLAATATDTTSLTFQYSTGTLIGNATYNAGTGRWELSQSMSTLSAKAIQAVATGAGGTTTSATRNFTLVASGGSLDPVVQTYVDTVNAKRSALSLGAMNSAQSDAWNECWLRLGNRDDELSRSWQPDVVDLFVLRNAYNVGGGEEAVGLKGTVLTRAGTTKPTFGADAVTFPGGDAKLSRTQGLLTGLTQATLVTVGRHSDTVAGATFQGYVSQQTSTAAGFEMTQTGDVSKNISSYLRHADGNGWYAFSVADRMAVRAAVAAGFRSGATEYPRIRPLEPADVEKMPTNTTANGTFTVAESPFLIGGRGSSSTSGLLGEVTAVLALNTCATDSDDLPVIWNILKATVLAGVVFGV